MRFPVLPSRALTVTAGLPFALAGSLALALSPQTASAAVPAWDEPRDDAAPTPPEPSPASAFAMSTPAEHVVQPGDTVSAIAGRYGLRTGDVLAANGLGWSSIIRPGQVIRLTGATSAVPAAAVAPAPAPPATTAHVVRAGDTISAIARSAGVSTTAVLDANGLTASSIIYPGQTIVVPSAVAPSAAAAPAVASAPAATAAPAQSSATLDAEQTENARLIIRVGRELGVSDRGIAIALGTAMVESWLRNLDWGDRDSLGLFQQRPSTGWGTPEQVLDPARSTRAFFGGASDPNGSATRGLLDIPGWESMAFADAAQAVQISAFPDRYAQWEQAATQWVAVLG
ncbi:LysM peptidoglycan-binding domain-containing protein [Microbacterium sp. NPDC091313]